ncbi:MAG: ABC transporter substrate-binding protein [Bifidobacterium ruminantium]|nr:ABC transporter substrate-binding protein [Bifidobacterium ruminantium]
MDENGRKRNLKDEATRWLIFLGVAAVLSVMPWLGLSLVEHKNPITSFGTLSSNSSVTIGIEGKAPESLDIRTEQGTAVEQALLGNVYETLVSRSDTNKLQPGIASSWQISDDGLTYTFALRDGMTFSNGHKLDSSDVVWSLQNTINNHYAGSDQLGDLKEITNPNADTVSVTLSKPNPRLLRALAGRAGVVYDQENKADYAKTAVGSGPFTVSDASKSQIVLQRNDSYWGSKAVSSQVTLYYYGDEDAMANAMKAGKIDMALPLSASAADGLGKTDGISTVSGISFDKVLLAFNNDGNSPFSDEQIRKMTRYAIDAQSIAKNSPDAYAVLGGPISPLEDGYEDLSGLYPYNLEQGQQMRSYFGANYIAPIDILVPKQYKSIGDTVKTAIESLNVGANLEVLDSAAEVTERMNAGTYNIALTTMSDEGDANVFASGQSVFHFENGDAQQAYANAMAATNDNDYQARMRDYARIVSEDAASDWLYTRKNFIAVSDQLQGYPKNLTDRLLPLSKVRLG